MLDTLSRWKRKLSSSTARGYSTEDGSYQTAHSGSASGSAPRQIRTISQPIPRSSPSSLSGSFVGGFDSLGNSISGSGGNVGNAWQEAVLSEIEDNRPMGTLGRRRMGGSVGSTSGSGLVQEVFGGGGEGVDGVTGSSAPAVVRLDSVPPQHQQQQQQMYPYVSQPQQFHALPKGTLRLQTNVHPQPNQQIMMTHPNRPLQPHQPDMSTSTGYVYHPHTIKQLSPIVEQDYITPTSTNSASLDYQSLKKAGSILGSILATPNSASAGRNSGGLRNSGSGSGSGSGDGGTNVGTLGSSRRQSGVTGGTGTTSGGSGHGHGASHPGGSPATPATAGTIGTVGTSGSGTAMGGGTPTMGYIPPQHMNVHVNVGETSFASTSGTSPLSQYETPTSHSNWSSPSAIPSPANGGPGVSPGGGSGGVGGGGVGNGSRSGTPEVPRPSPAHASPFLSRPLNRSASQGSSRARSSNTSMSTIPAPSVHGSIAASVGRQGSIKSVKTQQQQQQQPSSQPNQTPNATPTPSSILTTPVAPAEPVIVGPPTIPPLDLRPPFPGPHPSAGLRPPKRGSGFRGQQRKTAGVDMMPTIPGSHEGCYDEYDDEYVEEEYDHDHDEDDLESAPGEEVSAGYEYGYEYGSGYGYGVKYDEKDSERVGYGGRETIRYADEVRRSIEAGPSSGRIVRGSGDRDQDLEIGISERDKPIPHHPSASESFITRRWSRDPKKFNIRIRDPDSNRVRNSITTIFLRAKRQRSLFGLSNLTPAFWAFWLGFICPVLWLVGGWHFTSFGELPPKMSFWEFYFSGGGPNGGLREIFCCCFGRRRKVVGGEDVKGKGRDTSESAPLPRWIAEKQSSDDGRARLNDPKRSLRGIVYGYPFIARPGTLPEPGMTQHMLGIIGKPNRLLDQLYGVKLREVRGRRESGRRMFDPWIQRCRYAFCYTCVLVAIGLCTASMYLIVFNTRQLR